MKSLLLVLVCILGLVSAKICWEECSGLQGHVVSADIVGCRRRSQFYGTGDGRRMLFRCQGAKGPPCTVMRGDKVTLKVTLDHVQGPVNNVTQAAYWVTAMGINLPWAGMDNHLCKYMSPTCGQSPVNGQIQVTYDIQILELYPSGYFNLKWIIDEKHKDNQLACFMFSIRIV